MSELQTAWIAAAATCLATFITGIVSLLGLLTSKEQEISRFRQDWINDLRKDIASLIAHAYEIHGYFGGVRTANEKPVEYSDFWRATREAYLQLNKASTRIKLRLNPAECESRLILQSLAELEDYFKSNLAAPDEETQGRSTIDKITSDLERNMPPLLKAEWERVKRGERIYQRAKWIALAWVIATGLMTAGLVWATLRAAG